jgi:uncharacterized damage-inducible protein DinB
MAACDAEMNSSVYAAASRLTDTPRGFLVAHLLNHQTHHRGQVHAMLTACGQVTGDTDLFLVVEAAQRRTSSGQALRKSPH